KRDINTLILKPVWKEKACDSTTDLPVYDKHIIALCHSNDNLKDHIQEKFSDADVFALKSNLSDTDEQYKENASQLFEKIQKILKTQPKGNVVFQVINAGNKNNQFFSGFSGLLKTARLENPRFKGQLIDIQDDITIETIIEENKIDSTEIHIRYSNGRRLVRRFEEIKNLPTPVISWKEKGVYLITGGAGGLGRIFASEILSKQIKASLILTGRSPINDDIKAFINKWKHRNARIEYIIADINNKADILNVFNIIKNDFKTLNGIIHSAGIIRDNFIINKTKEEFENVLSVKVNGLMNLDNASQSFDLDFFILFSSISGVFGNVGQADYACANSFMDTFAIYRNDLVKANKRHGKTLSVNWPFWEKGGMKIDDATKDIMTQNFGIVPLQTENGLQAFYHAMSLDEQQVMIIEGNVPLIRDHALKTISDNDSKAVKMIQWKADPEILYQKTEYKIKALFEDITKVPLDDIDSDEPFDNLGMDSIMVTQFNQRLEIIFKDISKTVFYEYRTIEDLVEYFISDYPDACAKWCGLEETKISETQSSSTMQNSVNSVGKIDSIQGMNKRKSKHEKNTEPIAIIGISGRYPQAETIDEFWENLKTGKNSISVIPEDRWDWKIHYLENKEKAAVSGKSYSKWGGFIDDIYLFDPLFFNTPPREASAIDPQERLFLEECWKALEDAGYAISSLSPDLRKRTGVFGGITKQYNINMTTSFSSLVNRVSYMLNLQGPSMPIDTMCSSALTAIHEACEYIWSGKGDMAIAGGVNLYLHPMTYSGLSKSQMISNTSNCAAFGADGNGFVPGEGVGVVILKPLSLAEKDQDSIYALIRGTGVNHGGKTNSYNTPDPNRQADVIRQALENSHINPMTVSYIESAANGSLMGDAIEMTALTKIFSNRHSVTGNFKIGSVKPNIGHCEAASGMAQLTKVLLSLKHKTLVPTLITGEMNPNINFNNLPFELQTSVSDWTPLTIDGQVIPRIAGITSIGAGGVNAHILVEEYISQQEISEQSIDKSNEILFVLSARNQERLKEYINTWGHWLKNHQDIDLELLAYTLQTGREEMPARLAVHAKDHKDLCNQLKAFAFSFQNSQTCFYNYLKKNKPEPMERISDSIQTRNLNEIARLWVAGHSIAWHDLYNASNLFKLSGLPKYPFERRICRLDGENQQNQDNKAVAFYTQVVSYSSDDFSDEYLTFCPFEEKIPGFSMTRLVAAPDKYPEEHALMKVKQIELRQVLFYKEDFHQIHNFLDIGCGHGTDVIQIAMHYPHIHTHGFTITKAQADLGNKRIAEMNLTSQAEIFNKDSSKDSFPGHYDLMIGIEVTFHIRNKKSLFQNIANALNDNGTLLLMDYITNLKGAIVDPMVEITIPTNDEWIEILSMQNLRINELIDVSQQISNFLYDPDFEENIKDFDKVARDTLRNYANQSISLEKGWISYCLFKIKKDSDMSYQELKAYNTRKIAHKTPYQDALKDMRQKGNMPYPKSKKDVDEKKLIKKLSEKNVYQTKEKGQTNHIQKSVYIKQEQISPQNINGNHLRNIRTHLTDIFRKILGLTLQEMNQAQDFNELGIGSINAVELLEAINTAFNLNLPTSILFECSHLDSLVIYISDSLSKANEKHITEPASSNVQRKNSQYQSNQRCHTHVKQELSTVTDDDIAVIGLSCRCAEATNSKEFWDIIQNGKDCITDITNQNWLDFFKSHSKKKVPIRYGAMKDAAFFDSFFFNISPKEAEQMDPQQRVLLEESYKALQDAGYNPSLLSGQKVGTIIGTMGDVPEYSDYSHFSMLGYDTSISASRLAYFLNLKGPALAINTACSSSLVAIDCACGKLKSGEIDMAVTGGVHIYSHPGAFIFMNNAGMLSPTGQCRPFDNKADGIVVGDACGILILKRLSEAKRDNDHIYGIIKAIGTNQDGKTSGITVPSFLSQSELEASLYKKYTINVEDIQYIESHGTGTKLGDPVEIHALSKAFEQFTDKKRFCPIGSVKSNIGHTASASGVMGLIKVLLSLKHKQIPPSINYKEENEHINFDQSPVFVNKSLINWEINSSGSRLAAISSFGFSGTNAHAVIEEYNDERLRYKISTEQTTNETTEAQIIVLSAKNKDRLIDYARLLLDYCKENNSQNAEALIKDMAYSLQIGRESMEERLAIVVSSMDDLTDKLSCFIQKSEDQKGIYTGNPKHHEDKKDILIEGEEGKIFINAILQTRNVSKIAHLWVLGTEIDWQLLYDKPPKRISLPTYPFERKRY
ncbi:MAG: SDR family NAD(P)-dependent oxidoreductase, partial [Candidatus Magnetomorum sp.]|nr:SDR family NAD(P)-dependent oxidoreductase [Candidatus Magnetomorum sp.]